MVLVMLIDHELEAMAYYVKCHEEEGFEIQAAVTMDEAIDCTTGQRPDAIILDPAIPPGEHYPPEGTVAYNPHPWFPLYDALKSSWPTVPWLFFPRQRGVEESLTAIVPNAPVLEKLATSPRELVRAVKALLGMM